VGAALALGLAERVRRADRPSALEQGSYLELGGFLELRPDGALLSLGLDWVPLAVLELRAGYQVTPFFGRSVSLLRFDAPTARFGDDVLSAREGEEQTGFGQRLYASPVLRARLGPFVLRSEASARLYRMSSSPGYYYESEHDTLLAQADGLLDERAALLLGTPWDAGEAMLLVGPLYEYTRALRTGVARERVGPRRL